MNRAIVVFALVVLLPSIALAERVRAGAGRRVAVRGIRAVGRATGVRFEVVVHPDVDAATPYVLVPNHRSPVDIAAVLLARPDTRFIAARELLRIPLLAGVMRALDTVTVDRARRRGARHALAELAEDPNGDIVVFAEGGIREGELDRFRSGAFRVAIASGNPVVPVAIHGAAGVLPPGALLRVRPGTIVTELGAPIPTAGLTNADRIALRDRTRAAVLEALTARR